jgi:hypothetical protein
MSFFDLARRYPDATFAYEGIVYARQPGSATLCTDEVIGYFRFVHKRSLAEDLSVLIADLQLSLKALVEYEEKQKEIKAG